MGDKLVEPVSLSSARWQMLGRRACSGRRQYRAARLEHAHRAALQKSFAGTSPYGRAAAGTLPYGVF